MEVTETPIHNPTENIFKQKICLKNFRIKEHKTTASAASKKKQNDSSKKKSHQKNLFKRRNDIFIQAFDINPQEIKEWKKEV